MEIYKAKYTDSFGEEETVITNDGHTLRMILRSVEFIDTDFDGFQTAVTDPEKLSSFTFFSGSLCGYVLEWVMPVKVFDNGSHTMDKLNCRLELGAPTDKGHLEVENLHLVLELRGQTFSSCGKHGFFDDELLEIEQKLPENLCLTICHNCAFSHYSPAGYGLFGSLGCFRGYKEQARLAKHKDEVFALFTQGLTEQVQETHLCPKFEIRST